MKMGSSSCCCCYFQPAYASECKDHTQIEGWQDRSAGGVTWLPAQDPYDGENLGFAP